MSQDLFAAFGSPAAPSVLGTSGDTFHQVPSEGSSTTQQPPATHFETALREAGETSCGVDAEDDFGDFEDASNTGPTTASQAEAHFEPIVRTVAPFISEYVKKTYPPPKLSNLPRKVAYPPPKVSRASNQAPPSQPPKESAEVGKHPFASHMDLLFAADEDEYDAGADDIADLATNPEAAMAYSKRIIAAQQAEESGKKTSSPWSASQPSEQRKEPNKLRKKSRYVPASNAEVLFDAEEPQDAEAEDEGFADFETVDLERPMERPTSTAVATSSTIPAVELLSLNGPSTPAATTTSIPRSTTAEDDAWDDFETPDTPASTSEARTDINTNTPFQRSTTAIATKPAPSTTTTALLPPTNIPPPSVLLSIFPSLFTSAQETLFTPLSKLSSPQRQTLLAHPATHLFLRGYLDLLTVVARIIAGRRFRWKRDQYLAQGMRIGRAAAGGGNGGMKLAGVDRGEVAKEEREVLEAVRGYRSQVGKLRSAVASASAGGGAPDGKGKLPPVPDIAESMPVKTLKASEGGITAPHACALCGLKRDERVAKVDGEVNDSFGEWWVEGMNMHLLCRKFWEEHKGKLKTR